MFMEACKSGGGEWRGQNNINKWSYDGTQELQTFSSCFFSFYQRKQENLPQQ